MIILTPTKISQINYKIILLKKELDELKREMNIHETEETHGHAQEPGKDAEGKRTCMRQGKEKPAERSRLCMDWSNERKFHRNLVAKS